MALGTAMSAGLARMGRWVQGEMTPTLQPNSPQRMPHSPHWIRGRYLMVSRLFWFLESPGRWSNPGALSSMDTKIQDLKDFASFFCWSWSKKGAQSSARLSRDPAGLHPISAEGEVLKAHPGSSETRQGFKMHQDLDPIDTSSAIWQETSSMDYSSRLS